MEDRRGWLKLLISQIDPAKGIIIKDIDVVADIHVAPRLRATGLQCIPIPATLSSGNTQHLGTENNRFIDGSGSKFILQQVARPSGTYGAAEQYVHYLVNIKGPRSRQLPAERRRSGTP